MTTPLRTATIVALALGASVALSGCASLSSIDWTDRGSVGPVALDSSSLSAEVADALAATPSTMNEQIKVIGLRNARIRLSGYVGSSSAQSEALRIAARVDGVRDVLDTMSVR